MKKYLQQKNSINRWVSKHMMESDKFHWHWKFINAHHETSKNTKTASSANKQTNNNNTPTVKSLLLIHSLSLCIDNFFLSFSFFHSNRLKLTIIDFHFHKSKVRWAFFNLKCVFFLFVYDFYFHWKN